MIRICCWLTLLLCGGLLVALSSAQAQSLARLTLQLVPTTYSSRLSEQATISFSNPKHFHVLLTNASAASVALFEEWNSYEYYGLSFVLTYPDGRTVHVAKKPRGWDKNFPSTVTIAPGGFYIFDVDFDPTIWEHSPRVKKPAAEGSLRFRIRAVYTITAQNLSPLERSMWAEKGVPVWTGTLTSAERTVTLWP